MSSTRRLGGSGGAQRVAWTPTWERARALFTQRAIGSGFTPERDRAGNIWVELPGESDSLVVLGSHLDSVPAGGWLDGALGVWAGLGVLEGLLRDDVRPRHSVAVVDWADEEGARFGRSLYGSSAFVGGLDVKELAGLVDSDGKAAAESLARRASPSTHLVELTHVSAVWRHTSSCTSSKGRSSRKRVRRWRPSQGRSA